MSVIGFREFVSDRPAKGPSVTLKRVSIATGCIIAGAVLIWRAVRFEYDSPALALLPTLMCVGEAALLFLLGASALSNRPADETPS